LKTTKIITDDHQARVTAEFEQELLDQFKRKAARKIAQKTRIPGFRPGKAPYNMVLNHVGEGAVLEDALDLLVNEVYPKVLEQEGIEPYGPGNLEKITSQEPPVFEFLIPLAPETELNYVESLKKPYEPVVVTEADVDNFIEEIRREFSEILPFEGAAEEGHLVYMTITAHDINTAEGDDSMLFNATPQQTMIPPKSKEKESEWPFKGFARSLIGKKEGEQFLFNHTYPEDEEKHGDFSGKTVRFDVNIQSVKHLKLPLIDEDFLEKIGGFESEEALRERVLSKLEVDGKAAYDEEYYLGLIDTLRESAVFKYPPQMVQDEEESVLHRIEHDLSDRGLDLDVYLKLRKIDKETFMENEVRSTAKDRMERSLVMDAIVKKYELQVKPDELQAEVAGVINSLLMSGEYEKAQKELGKKRFAEAISSEAANIALENKIRKQLLFLASPESVQKDEPAVEVELTAKEEPSVYEEIVEETVVEAPEDSNHDEEAED
jgi:trigger factor